jgi:hypothetical protein
MSKTAATVIAVIILAGFTASASASELTCTGLKSDRNIYPAPTTVPFPKVGYLQSYTDPVFGTKITRVTGDPGTAILGGGTWSNQVNIAYSKVQVWNADESLMFIAGNRTAGGGTGPVLIDGSTYQPVASVRCPGVECRWHPTDPAKMIWVNRDQIGEWFPRTGAANVIATFNGYSNFHIGPNEGNLSLDGSIIVVSGQIAGAGPNIAFAYDMVKRVKYPDILVNKYGDRLNWASISPAGDYVVLAFSGERHSVVLDLTGRLITRINNSQPTHYDMTIDGSGDEVAVGSNRPGSSFPHNGAVIKVRLRDGELTPLTTGGFARHTSTRDTTARAFAVSSMEPQTRLPPYNDEIVLVRLDGSVVYRLAHTYNNMIDFPSEVIPSISPSGTRVIFQSNWLSPTGRPTQVYVIDLRQNCSNQR